MPRPDPLTDEQKGKLKELEPQLKSCVKTGNFDEAKKIAARIQHLLKPTGHTARWMQNTNWFAECALEAGKISIAIQRLNGVRAIMSKDTRTYLEATALLAICYIRKKSIKEANHFVDEVFSYIRNIKSNHRRHQFYKRFISRLEEECILAGMINAGNTILDVDEVQSMAISMQTLDENGIMIALGKAVPTDSVALLECVRSNAVKQIPLSDRKALPTPKQSEIPRELGMRANAALKRVVWRAVCDPNDEIYQAWSQGLAIVYDKKWLTAAIIASFKSWNIAIGMVVVSVVALAFKMGVKVFCDVFAPESIMIGLRE